MSKRSKKKANKPNKNPVKTNEETVAFAAVFSYAWIMTTTTKSRIKKALLFLAGIIVGAFLAYAFMWYQVYQKFNLVYTCQIFTGALSIEEQEMCAKYDPAHKPRYY